MDPNAAFERWREALRNHDRIEALDAAEALAGWLERGGFEPDWTEPVKVSFIAWCDAHEVRP